ncbi:hypothetical protein C1O63_0540 [Dehalococcoides mccartyi]|nr:hypothetical protein B1778_01415 [Dehalococcoides mccartyi]POZ59402.1 hypothetical protein C1O63_0540 [Dehalococcoides mccartyi]
MPYQDIYRDLETRIFTTYPFANNPLNFHFSLSNWVWHVYLDILSNSNYRLIVYKRAFCMVIIKGNLQR